MASGASVTDAVAVAVAVQAMVDAAMQAWGRIDILVNNAGILRDKSFTKMALVGLMQTLAIEGAKNNIRVNCLAATAATRMTEGLMPEAVFELLQPAAVPPGLLALVAEDAPTRAILCAGAGAFERAYITMTPASSLACRPTQPSGWRCTLMRCRTVPARPCRKAALHKEC